MKNLVNAFHSLPPTAQKWAWFIGLWLASVATIGTIATLIRNILL